MGIKIPVIYLPLSVDKPIRLQHVCAVLAGFQMAGANTAEVIPIVTDIVTAEWEKNWQRDFAWIGQALDAPEKLGPFLFKKTYRQSERVAIYQQVLSQLVPAPGYDFFLKKVNSFGTKLEPVSYKSDTFFSGESKIFESRPENGVSLLIGATASEVAAVKKPILLWDNSNGPSAVFARYADYVHFSMDGLILPGSDLNEEFDRLVQSVHADMRPQIWRVPEVVTPTGDRLLDFSQEFFQAKGFLPHALASWLQACGIAKGPVTSQVYSVPQLNRLNSRFLQELDLRTIVRFVLPFFRQHQVRLANRKQVFLLVDVLRSFFSDLSSLASEAKRLLCTKRFNFNKEIDEFVRRESSKIVLWSFLRQLGEYEHLQRASFLQIIQQVQLESGLIGTDLWRPIRLVLTGVETEYDLAAVVELLGREKCGERLRNVLGDYW